MVQNKFNLIVAACENSGIGIRGNLPWRLKYVLTKDFLKLKVLGNIFKCFSFVVFFVEMS